jgi:hypothetical protein
LKLGIELENSDPERATDLLRDSFHRVRDALTIEDVGDRAADLYATGADALRRLSSSLKPGGSTRDLDVWVDEWAAHFPSDSRIGEYRNESKADPAAPQPSWQRGNAVEHATLGRGRISEVRETRNGQLVIVDFPGIGERRVMASALRAPDAGV